MGEGGNSYYACMGANPSQVSPPPRTSLGFPNNVMLRLYKVEGGGGGGGGGGGTVGVMYATQKHNLLAQRSLYLPPS